MLSSTNLYTLLFLFLQLLIATTSQQSVLLQLRAIENTTTTIAEETKANSTLQPTPAAATTTTTATPATATSKIIATLRNNVVLPSREKEIFEKNVKIIFPSANESNEESPFDVYGLKTTPKPKEHIKVNITNNTTNAADDYESLIDTTTVATIIMETGSLNNAATSNSTVKSLDDRLGILNLAPRCPDGYVIVNQRCHQRA